MISVSLIIGLTYEYSRIAGAGPELGVALQAGGVPYLNVMGELLYPRVLL